MLQTGEGRRCVPQGRCDKGRRQQHQHRACNPRPTPCEDCDNCDDCDVRSDVDGHMPHKTTGGSGHNEIHSQASEDASGIQRQSPLTDGRTEGRRDGRTAQSMNNTICSKQFAAKCGRAATNARQAPNVSSLPQCPRRQAGRDDCGGVTERLVVAGEQTALQPQQQGRIEQQVAARDVETAQPVFMRYPHRCRLIRTRSVARSEVVASFRPRT